MRFLGIDFGWQGKPSGLAALDLEAGRLRRVELERRDSLKEVLAFVDEKTNGRPALVAVDAPLIIPNASGMRHPERLCHQIFGKHHAGTYPMNRSRPAARLLLELEQELRSRSFTHADQIIPQRGGRYMIEVFPHPAIVRLFGLERIIKYKKGQVSERRSEMQRYRTLIIEKLPALIPPLEVPDLPAVPSIGRAMKELEDKLDALLCAYIGAFWWYWGLKRNEVLGDVTKGYIVIPKP